MFLNFATKLVVHVFQGRTIKAIVFYKTMSRTLAKIRLQIQCLLMVTLLLLLILDAILQNACLDVFKISINPAFFFLWWLTISLLII